MLRALSTTEVLKTRFESETSYKTVTELHFKFNPADTYMLVFSVGQDELMEKFKELTKDTVKIIFEGKKAHNRTLPGFARNTLIIFETIEEPKNDKEV